MVLCFSAKPKAEERIRSAKNSEYLGQPWGMNAHLLFDCSSPYMDELCKSMAQAGVQTVRIDVYWWYNNMMMQRDLCDMAMYYTDKYGLDVLLNFPQVPNTSSDQFVDDYTSMIKTYLTRYNGETLITIDGETQSRRPKVKYVEMMNEIELKQEKQPFPVESVCALLNRTSKMIRLVRSDVLILAPGLARCNEYVKALYHYSDEEGNKLADYLDVFNTHVYAQSYYDFDRSMNTWMELKKSSGFDRKPFWVTEYGGSTWHCTEQFQADLLAKNFILGTARGVDKMFYYQFHQYGGNFFCDRNQNEDFFGIIENSTNNSYASFWENDGIFVTPLSEGDATKKVFVNEKNKDVVSLYTLKPIMCEKLKAKGVAIGGKGYTINKVEIVQQDKSESLIWAGHKQIDQIGKDILRIGPEAFSDIKETDKLVVSISDVKNLNNEWTGVSPMPAYAEYQLLSTILNERSTRPIITRIDNDINIAVWKNDRTEYYCALWTDKSESREITFESLGKVFKVVSINKRNQIKSDKLLICKHPLFLYSKKEILIK